MIYVMLELNWLGNPIVSTVYGSPSTYVSSLGTLRRQRDTLPMYVTSYVVVRR